MVWCVDVITPQRRLKFIPGILDSMVSLSGDVHAARRDSAPAAIFGDCIARVSGLVASIAASLKNSACSLQVVR